MGRPGVVVLVLAFVLPAAAGAGVSPKRASAEVRMSVRGVKHDQSSYVVLLQADGGGKVLPIWIGDREAQAIQMRLSGGRNPRPLTHDLLENLMATLSVKVVRVEVDDLRDNVFYGKLTLRQGTKEYRIDGRPSDLITIAVGAKLPIFVSRHVLEKAGAPPAPATPAPGAKPQEI